MKIPLLLSALVAVVLGAGCASRPPAASPLMHVYQPADTIWDVPLPQPAIPPPPTDTGLSAPGRLVDMAPIEVEGNDALAALPGITGSGTAADPYVLENGRFTVDDTTAISITKTTVPLVIRNMQFNGVPQSADSPSRTAAVRIVDCRNVTISHCELSRCNSIYLGGSALNGVLVEYCKLTSCINGIFSSGGRNVRALHNYVRDAVKYGVFLYNGADHEIGWNYVAWTGREGIGTNGTAPNHYYHDNTVLHCGWTAVNVEGATDNARVENNLVVSTYYGIILMGADTACRGNQVFYSGQDGILIVQSEGVRNVVVEDNLIVGCGQNGIWAMAKSSGHTLRRNRIAMTNTAINNNAVGTRIEANDLYQSMYGVQNDQPNVTIADNRVYQGRNGIALNPGHAGPVQRNELHHLCIGLIAKKLTGDTIAENTLKFIGQPVRLYESRGVTVADNQFVQQGYLGIDIADCHACVIRGNVFRNATVRAIKIQGGDANQVVGNRVTDCHSEFNGAGLILANTAHNEIRGNTFLRCAVPILDEDAVRRTNTFADNHIERPPTAE